ncbi:MAG: PPC domain-containing protein [Brevundimonas diminuta]|jgi:Bacterial pre-peptidase C-terminal domain|uniref:PPC domain-containing protein n=1 Tax=Brevundimonas diminuta TaxID=293 RepID=UPI000EEC4331|nr:PPC domain-containing protein [Brevundimonas diminuta]MBI2248308.1 PPC domain-containing protein [Brevundimonas diminuta]HCQ53033.1 peptidase [Brevundimonas diminuta]
MRYSLLAAVSAVALLSTGAAWAQSAADARLGDDIRGRLEDGDARTRGSDGYRYDDYRVNLRAGQRLEAQMTSDDFDAYLEVYAEGSLRQSLASDDDSAGDLNARLRFTAPEAGVYIVRARTFSGIETGDYQLSLKERAAPRMPRPGRIAVGRDETGSLGGNSAEDDDGKRYDAYAFRASAGERVKIDLESDDFDSFLRVGRIVNGAFVQMAENDDGGSSLNARLVFTAPQAGEYLIRVTSYNGSAEGDYRLSMEQGPPAPTAAPVTIGEETRGRLNSDSATSDSGAPADLYRFSGRAGQRVAITMKADGFDTYLELFDANHNSLATDDDSAGDLNARLTHTLAEDGDYLIEARAFSSGEGPYTLNIEEIAPPPPPSAIAFGQTVEGELTDSDATDDDGRRYDAFVFSGTEGQRIQAVMRSGDFDAYLQLGENGEEFSEIASDDDGLGQGTDARLIFTLPETGEYVLRARSWSRDAKGLYALELQDLGGEPSPGSLLIGSTVRARLTERASITDEGIYYDAYRFKAKADEKLRFTLIASSFDAVVEVGEEKDGDYFKLEEDDDSLSDTHARLNWTAPRDGSYVLRARSFGSNSTGDYVLITERQP